MSKQVGPLTKNWNAARQAITDGKLDEATDYLDTGIAYLSMYTMNGISDKEFAMDNVLLDFNILIDL